MAGEQRGVARKDSNRTLGGKWVCFTKRQETNRRRLICSAGRLSPQERQKVMTWAAWRMLEILSWDF